MRQAPEAEKLLASQPSYIKCTPASRHLVTGRLNYWERWNSLRASSKKVVFAVRGHEAFSFLTYETGVDRVQRVPEDERQGRIYTSTAVVTVIRHDVPEARWLLDEEVYRLFASYQERGTERPPGSRASGDRREKIRTYNFPDDRVTDHRIGFHIYGVRDVLGGNLGPLLDELRKRDQG